MIVGSLWVDSRLVDAPKQNERIQQGEIAHGYHHLPSKALPRTEFGKGAARRMRVANLIPATVYAGGEEPVFVQLPMKETTLSLRHTNALFTIKFG